ncbi:MAG: hypothetical protein R3E39_28680 [Anaerolineae bacterium]
MPPLIKTLIKLSLLLLIMLTGTSMLIHAQPYDDEGLRGLVYSEDCQPPCFMGIQPGVTSMNSVYDILSANPWVDGITSRFVNNYDSMAVTWTWNGRQPAIFDGERGGTVNILFTESSSKQTASSIILPLNLPAGYIILLLGDLPPDYSGALGKGQRVYLEASYPESDVMISAITACPLTRWNVWTVPITLRLSHNVSDPDGLMPIKDVC